jgi:monofunctional biosynthetic peptidoglycan transglycosylase
MGAMTEDVTEKPAQSPKPAPRRRKAKAEAVPAKPRLWRRVTRWVGRVIGGVVALYAFLILLFSFVPPPINMYQLGEAWRLGGIERQWVSWDEIAPVMGRAAVAAEDANFCNHWGFDIAELRKAIAAGSNRGASTISQQVVKNVFLWPARTYARKAMEAILTPVVELVWSKQRILEVYLNVAEFGEGVFGVQAAARHYFGVDAKDLSALQAARLAAILPDPKGRDAANPSNFVRNRTRSIMSGADTIKADGRSACFED